LVPLNSGGTGNGFALEILHQEGLARLGIRGFLEFPVSSSPKSDKPPYWFQKLRENSARLYGPA